MSYVQESLTKDEVVVLEGKISLFSLIPYVLWAAAFFWFPVISFGILFYAAIKLTTQELAVTNKRIVAKTGWISRQTLELSIKKVEGVNVDQGVLGRIFNYGTITVSGTGSSGTPIKGVDKPIEFRKKALEILDK